MNLLAPALNVGKQTEQASGDFGVLGGQRRPAEEGGHVPKRIRPGREQRLGQRPSSQ